MGGRGGGGVQGNTVNFTMEIREQSKKRKVTKIQGTWLSFTRKHAGTRNPSPPALSPRRPSAIQMRSYGTIKSGKGK